MSAVTRTKQAAELVRTERGKVTTTSLLIAEKFGKSHNFVLKKIDRLACSDEFHRANFAQSFYLAENGKQEKSYAVTEEGFMFIAMRFTGPEAVRWQEAFVAAFQRMRAELERLTRQRQEPAWQLVRDETKLSFRWMAEALKEQRSAAGKETRNVHFMNEAKLIHGVLTGRFRALCRDKLSGDELALLADLQRRDALLLARGVPYQERKASLQAYLGERRPMLGGAA